MGAAMETVPEPGLTGDEVEQIVAVAVGSIPEPQTGLSAVEVAAAIRTVIESILEPAPASLAMKRESLAFPLSSFAPPKGLRYLLQFPSAGRGSFGTPLLGPS